MVLESRWQTSTTMAGPTFMSPAIKLQASYMKTGRDGTFVERAVEAGVAYNYDGRLQSGMGVAVADFDGNGFLDIAKTNFSGDMPSLYLNEDGRFYHDTAQESGLGAHQLLGWGYRSSI